MFSQKAGFTAIVILLAGCVSFGSAHGPQFQEADPPSSGHAVLYIYRPEKKFNSGGFPYIYLNDEKKLPMRMGGYMIFNLDPGRHEIKAVGSTWGTNWWPGPASRVIELEANQEYFVRVVPVGSPATLIETVPKNTALDEIYFTRLIQK